MSICSLDSLVCNPFMGLFVNFFIFDPSCSYRVETLFISLSVKCQTEDCFTACEIKKIL